MRKFGRETDQRRAFIRSLASNLVLNEKIKTTEARAKELRSFVERIITQTKSGNLAGLRLAKKELSAPALKKLSKEIAPRFKEKRSGYTRITKLGRRMSDSASMAFIELIK
ncbi:MAG: 50S ribosomal protein L17 [Parcubacteria group bacterium GW2011_GWA1_42_7]|nr:MAG: 50S ribosomal protein L17 [Parcubacteria group bacterium GW2011_GWB1_42_6]KKS70169.1 MAG: 50S ribosomal protein L17 [Parcubacteria group bacterium GW2011_GWA1_42_7]KKS92417.1 MAG: 50S ribosomal protein L17 [Parcubacteria group bacterium GW2011_GWC1_43_12]